MLRTSNILCIQSPRGTYDLPSAIFFASWQLAFGRYNSPKFERFCWTEIFSLVHYKKSKNKIGLSYQLSVISDREIIYKKFDLGFFRANSNCRFLFKGKRKLSINFNLGDFKPLTYPFSIDIIQEEYSVRFTLLFHAHCAQRQRVNQNMIVTSPRTTESHNKTHLA